MNTSIVEQRTVGPVCEHLMMRWGAVFAGWFVATGIAIMLYVFGLAVGFSAVNFHDAAVIARGISIGAIVWMILTWSTALWIGAMFASWFDGRNDTEMGLVRGVAVWGVSMAATGVLMASGLMHVAFVAAVPGPGPTLLDPAVGARYTAALMWTAFGSALLSLITSGLGGWLGSRHVHHVYHLREYTPHARGSSQ